MSEQVEFGAAHRRLTYAREDHLTPVACVVADLIRHSEHVKVSASKTDLYGQYGEPEVYTEWVTANAETVVLREHRWPSPHSGEPDPYRCEHYALTTEGAGA